jgi:hypothetical protein
MLEAFKKKSHKPIQAVDVERLANPLEMLRRGE